MTRLSRPFSNFLFSALFAASLSVCSLPAHAAREASFLDPGATTSTGGSSSGTAVSVEPRSEIDLGEGQISLSRRATIFFVNQTTLAIEVSGTTISSDGGVKADIVSDDCAKEGKIDGNSRCVVVVELTPTVPGPWRAEILLAHKGAGRVARAKLLGKATGQLATEKKDAGLSLSVKDIKPVDFGTIDVGLAPAVRSAVMVNDSMEPITILSIDVIAAENGLDRLDQGCALDMELQPGESCPVTLRWKPEQKGLVSTDLIIRHTGKLGFAVIPVRGIAQEPEDQKGSGKTSVAGSTKDLGKNLAGAPPSTGKKGAPALPTAAELDMMAAGKIPPISGDLLPDGIADSGATSSTSTGGTSDSSESKISLRLIGTVGNKGVFLLPDGTTQIAGVDETLDTGDKETKVTNIMPREAEVFINGKKRKLQLERAVELVKKAAKSQSEKKGPQKPNLSGPASVRNEAGN